MDKTLTQSLIVVPILFVGFVVFLLQSNKDRSPMFRYNKTAYAYRTASAKITSVEEEDVYIDPYKPKEEIPEVFTPQPTWLVRRNSLSYFAENEAIKERNKLVRMRNSRIGMGITSEQPKDVINKKRCKVHYEFEAADGRTHTGEGVFFNNNGIEVGKYIEVRYKSDKPQANLPVGNSHQ